MSLWFRALMLCGLMLPLHAQDQPPAYPAAFTGRAEYETTAGFKEAGWASLVAARQGAPVYIISVRSLLGPAGGFSHQVKATDVPAFVRAIKIDSFSGGVQGYVVGGVPVTSSDADPLQRPPDNLALFQIHNEKPMGRYVVLASTPPAVGDTVWLMTKTEKPDLSLIAATVVSGGGDKWLAIQLKSGTSEALKETSGAPVLNGGGELVGISSHHDAKDPATFDLIPAATILKLLPSPPTAGN